MVASEFNAEALGEFLKRHGIEHFTAREVAPRGVPRELWPNILPTLRYAEMLRVIFGPISVHSGYRSRAYNAKVGGAPNSLHMQFNALDIAPRDGTPTEWVTELEDMGFDLIGGIGIGSTYIHIDTRCLMLGMPRATWSYT